MSNKHFYILFSNLGLGGVQRKIVDITSYILKKYPQVIIHIVVRSKSKYHYPDFCNSERVMIHYPTYRFIHRFRQKYIIFIFKLFLKYPPCGVLAYLQQNYIWALKAAKLMFWRKINVVVSQDNVLSIENNFQFNKIVVSNKQIYETYSEASKIIAQTEYVKNDLINNFGISQDKIVIIPNWVTNLSLFESNKKYDLIYCGRYEKQKRLDDLIKVIAIVKKDIPQINAVFFGEGSQKRKILDWIKQYKLENNIRIFSFTNIPILEISRAKLFVMTSVFEGMPMVVLEAMSQQVPLVTMKYPGSGEYVTHGMTGYIEDDIEQMARRIILLLKNNLLREKIGVSARAEIISKYNISLIDKTLKLFNFT
jgi:glycosyltransferase involved in cell wall biosynthesis